MAKRLNADDGEQNVTKTHNVEHRNEALRNAMARTFEIDSEIADLIEEHIKELRDEKSDIKTRLRDDYGMPSKVFNCRYASYRLERKARESDDQVMLDTIRELFDATPVGGQLDFVDAAKAADAKAGNGAAEHA